MKKIAYVLILLASFISAQLNYLSAYNNTELRADYVKRLENVINMLKVKQNKKITLVEIQYVIPMSDEEFHEFYSYSYKTEFSHAFEHLSGLFIKYATQRKHHFFILYLKFAEFVDGEFAEGYFESLESVIKKNKKYYCRIQSMTSQRVRDRISDHFDANCSK